MLAAFGLSALLVASVTAFTIIKFAGAFYLVWLGIQAIRHGSALTLKKGEGRPKSVPQVFLMGVAINLLNPKIVMFFLTFLPQFISVSDPHAPQKLLFFGLYFIVISIPICSAMILTADRFTGAMRNSPRAMRIFDWMFAGLMGGFALRLLLARGN
jgi:threonine/homoserine/homoserine lactone efflux protein